MKIKRKEILKVFLIELIFFTLTLFLGVLISYRVSDLFETAHALEMGNSFIDGDISSFQFLIYFAVSTILIVALSKSKRLKKKRKTIFRAIFFISIFIGGMISLSVFIPDIFSFIILLVLFLAWKKYSIILLHNLMVCLSIAGIGVIMGSVFDPIAIVIFLVLFSVYDFIAVYKTKHMIKMAKEMVKTKAIMGIITPFSFSGLLDDFGKKKKGDFLILGGGDLAFPLFLVSSVTINYGVKEALFLTVFCTIGLAASFSLFIFQKKRRAIPALPPIAFFSILGYLVLVLF